MKTTFRRLADWFYRIQGKWVVRCRDCNRTQVVAIRTTKYFDMLNDTPRGPWSWRAVNKQRNHRMTTEHICRKCLGT